MQLPKVSIYPEMLPEYTEGKADYVMLDQFFDYMSENTSATVIDVRDELTEEKKNNQLYWKMDTHWNYYGAYIGYKAIMDAIPDAAATSIDDFEVVPYKKVCDISKNMLGLGTWIKEDTESLEQKNKNYTIENPEKGFFISTSDDSNAPTMYFIRDSFGRLIQEYLAASFSEVYSTINNDDIPVPAYAKDKTYDYVVIEVTERSLTTINRCITNELGIVD